jgi:Flp pilus assembly pilin Flp
MLFLRREDGQGQTEYALLLVLVAIMLIALLSFVGQFIISTYAWITAQISNV